MKINNILISQSLKGSNSPYLELSKNVKIDFRSFIEVKGASSIDVRKQKINFSDFTVVLFISKNSVDHYFRLAESMRFKVPISMKYICQTESIAYYLQKYIVYRKRKIYIGKKSFKDILPFIKKNTSERFLLPSSDILKLEIPKMLNKLNISWKRAILYKTTSSDLSDLKKIIYYDILVFFSPACIKSLFENFPNFDQNNIKIATFGKNTLDAAYKAGLKIEIRVPTPEFPSMAKALEKYIKEYKKK
ncbi:uroporphyrinogen-III synthase [Blattabacterium punctulatus]|uniref:Uroporphyrinogen-III synthase n=1 Tax=Blattabacterium punctulatus TaxID=164514 RepID=A0ABN5M1X8_9FLAO|nr:uroporphyrinogen-III synthase [Blattabacterium punctulatus]AWU39830.1 uroporphyrinogen-III synthase [Blattabacterium punctulatus]AWU40374.1 uroporphyrinogen-III synthase [Blattabacterium punctulatus]